MIINLTDDEGGVIVHIEVNDADLNVVVTENDGRILYDEMV